LLSFTLTDFIQNGEMKYHGEVMPLSPLNRIRMREVINFLRETQAIPANWNPKTGVYEDDVVEHPMVVEEPDESEFSKNFELFDEICTEGNL
jgi:hypothetical protein